MLSAAGSPPPVVAMASIPAFILIASLICAYGLEVARCQCHNSTELSIQLDTLLAEYDREIRPPSDAGLVLQVTLDVKHAAVDQDHSTMRLLTDFKMTWIDQRVKWNKTEWGCDYAVTAAERLWLPDIVLLNAAATGVSSSPNDVGLRARLDSDGIVTWVMRLDLTAPVALDLYDWPKDTQSCVFYFGSRAYASSEVTLHITDIKNAVVFESGAWEIKSVAGDSLSYYRGDEEASSASWTVYVVRRAPAHSLAATTVLIATAMMLVGAVALPPDQRHALAACASFTAALWLITALLRLPGARSCPRVMSLMCALCASGAACSASAALVRRVAACTAPPPRLLRNLLSSLSTLCRLTPSSDTTASAESGAWAAAAVLVDRVLCGALLLTLVILLAIHIF